LKPNLNRNKGFTLIEVLIALAIFAWIGIFVYRFTTQAHQIGNVINNEGDFYNEVRLSMNILEQDIEMMFSPEMILRWNWKPADPDAIRSKLGPYLEGLELRSTDYWNAVVHESGVRPSRFQGDEKSMSFITASHVRIYKDAPESVFARVRYELRADKFPPEGVEGTQVLVKMISADAFSLDDTDKEKFKIYPLLSGIKKFRVKYYQKEKDNWSNSWDSDSSDYKDKLPDAVQVELEVTRSIKLSFDGLYQFKLELPLNDGFPTSF